MDKQEFLTKYTVERHGTSSQKWDSMAERFGESDLLAMWVADMDFRTCDAIIDVLRGRVDHGVFGYPAVPDGYYEAFADWMRRRHGVAIGQRWVRFCPGVVQALYWLVNAFTKPDDAVAILTPVYYPFHNAVRDTGRRLVTVDLIDNHGYFVMDFASIEDAFRRTRPKMIILCSPHNPVGRVWTESELADILALCDRYDVMPICDEIHQDIIIGPSLFVSALNVADGAYRDKIIVLSAASKTFNVAGLVHGHIVIPSESLRAHYDTYAKTINLAENSLLGMLATMAGYLHGDDWLDTVLGVIKDNYEYVKAELAENVPEAVVCALEGTYLLFIDLRQCLRGEDSKAFIQDHCRLAVDFGEWFGDNFTGYVRLNLATHPKFIETAIASIVREAHRTAN